MQAGLSPPKTSYQPSFMAATRASEARSLPRNTLQLIAPGAAANPYTTPSLGPAARASILGPTRRQSARLSAVGAFLPQGYNSQDTPEMAAAYAECIIISQRHRVKAYGGGEPSSTLTLLAIIAYYYK